MAWTNLGTVAPGDVLRANSGTAAYNNVIGNLGVLYGGVRRYAQQTFDGTYTTNTTSLASALNIFASNATWTAKADTEYRIELMVPYCITGSASAATVACFIVDGSGNELMSSYVGTGDGTHSGVGHFCMQLLWTPGSGSKSVNARAIHAAQAGSIFGRVAFEKVPIRLTVWGEVI